MECVLPVSLGEAIDKYTILQIKEDKIKDKEKLVHVRKERQAIEHQLESVIKTFSRWTRALYWINERIWNMQDEFRYGSKEDKVRLCLQIIDDNDKRFRIKSKINRCSKSSFQEQKGYRPSQVSFYFYDGCTKAHLYYLGICYDGIEVVTKEKLNIQDPDIRLVEESCLPLVSLPILSSEDLHVFD